METSVAPVEAIKCPLALTLLPLRRSRGILAGGRARSGIPASGLVIFEVTPALVLKAEPGLNSQLTLTWNGGPRVKLQKTLSLAKPNWQEVAGSDGVSTMEPPVTELAAFFRLVRQ
jgi:hypothetical protein